MIWGRSTLVLLCGLGLACGPEGQAAPETESDGETETGGSTGDSGPTSMSVSVSVGSMTGSTTRGDSTTDEPPPPPPDSSAGDDPPPPITDTGECPFGTEGCLCDVGSMCDEGLECIDGTCVAPPSCMPIDTDAHADEDSAYPLEAIDCGNGVDLGVIATLEGPETDWYTYQGSEQFGCPENPAAAVATDITTDVCVFIECINGDLAPPMCADGSMAADSPGGRMGCCGQDQATIAGYDCFGFGANKDVNVWISVGTTEETCSDYSMSYSI